MCGLFGFVSSGGSPDGELIRVLAAAAATRGPDSWGVAAGKGGRFRVVAEPGRYDGRRIEAGAGVRVVVGHCRLATVGGLGVIQPLVVPGGVVAHNGNYYGHARIARALGLIPKTDCDSEVLGMVASGLSGETLGAAVERAYKKADRPSRTAALFAAGNRLGVLVAGQPLFSIARDEGVYVCSRRWPGATRLADGHYTWGTDDS